MNHINKLNELGIKRVGYWKLNDKLGSLEQRHNNSITFYIDKERDKSYTNLRCLYVFTCEQKVVYVGKTNQGLSKRLQSYCGTSNALNRSSRDRKTLSDRFKIEKLISLLEQNKEVFIYSFFDDKEVYYKNIKINLSSGLEDPIIDFFQPELNEDGREKPYEKQLDMILNVVRLKNYDNLYDESEFDSFSDFMRQMIDEFELEEKHLKTKHFSFSYTEIHKKRKVNISKEQEQKLFDLGKKLNLRGKGQVGCFILDQFAGISYDDMKHLDKGQYHTSKKFPKRIVFSVESKVYESMDFLKIDLEFNYVGQVFRHIIQQRLDNSNKKINKIIDVEIPQNGSKISPNKFKKTTIQFTENQFIFYKDLKSNYKLSHSSLVTSLVEDFKNSTL